MGLLDYRLSHLLSVGLQQSIILFEDVDTAFVSRGQPTDEDSTRPESNCIVDML